MIDLAIFNDDFLYSLGGNILIEQTNSQFNMFPSHIGLSKYIQYYNIVFPLDDTYSENYTLMPNACGTISIAFDGANVIAELWGASASPVMLGKEPSDYKVLLLIQLTPIGLFQITGQSQAEFTDKRLLLEDVDSKLFKALHDVFLMSRNTQELANACEQAFARRMEKQIVSDAVLLATKTISDIHGQIMVNEVARQACYSERQLNRLFQTQIGMNVKNYTRIIRFDYVLDHIQASPCFLTTLSQQAGYFDQAHFDKDFKAFSGVTPLKYIKMMSDFYYDSV